MAIFEEKYINPLIKNMPILYLWYTDNIFIIWKGNYDDLTNFLDNITKQHRTMKLGVKKNGFIFGHKGLCRQRSFFTVFHNETDCQSYLHSKFEHPLSGWRLYTWNTINVLECFSHLQLYLKLSICLFFLEFVQFCTWNTWFWYLYIQ